MTRGQPRVNYPRTYVLLPPNAGAALVKIVINATHDKWRYTVGGSADDAAIGDLDVRRIIALRPSAWDGDLEAFFVEHYPGIEYCILDWDNDYQLRGRLLAMGLHGDGFRLTYPTTHMPAVVTDDFGVWRGNYYHNGLDLRASWRAWGDHVLCGVTGKVVIACVHPDEPWFGVQVRVEATNGVLVRHAHLIDGSLMVRAGDYVQAGLPIGKAGSTGTSTADHLHIDVKMGKEYADPALLIEWPPDEQPQPSLPAFTLRGVHDRAGADWLLTEGLQGWAVLPVYLGTSAQDLHLERYADNDIRVIVRLNYSYAVDDPGGAGTMPPPSGLAAHEDAVVKTMELNPHAWGFIYGNEPNNPREWPRDFAITPEYYRDSYNRIWARKPKESRLSPCAIDPYNAAG